MATFGFEICLIISVCVLVYMAAKNYENISIYDWTFICFIPVVILGYWLNSRVSVPEACEMAYCFIYIDSSILLLIAILAMLHNFGINVKSWIKALGYLIAISHLFLVWECFGTNLYYSTITVTKTASGSVTKLTSGPLKIFHVVYLCFAFIIIVALLIFAYIKKGNYSRRILHNYSVAAILLILTYAVETFFDTDFTLLPYLYVMLEIMVAVTYDHLHLHDIAGIISGQEKYSEQRGYVALDLKLRLMSFNDKALDFAPFIKSVQIDEPIPESESFFFDMVEDYKKKKITKKKYAVGERTFECEIAEITRKKGDKAQGYLFDFRDATEEQKAIDVMTSYNETLNAEIEKKTENILNIQRKITVGMANIIENRDNNTGGHVKRTSDVIGIIVDEIIKSGEVQISPEFAEDIVRAAPTHDLGKISIDSSILCKPSRLTDEEYAIMKTHSVKSGEMVKILLDGVEAEHFVNTAFNVARYHHERWDGRGYPEGLVGTMIPIEARIMAIADVYDALVSKRCYKESLSFEKAKEIMLEGMGTQFDPNLRRVFLGCVDKLEEYYRKV